MVLALVECEVGLQTAGAYLSKISSMHILQMHKHITMFHE